MGASLEDLSHPPAARLKIANDEHQIALACVDEYGIKFSDIGSMEEDPFVIQLGLSMAYA